MSLPVFSEPESRETCFGYIASPLKVLPATGQNAHIPLSRLGGSRCWLLAAAEVSR